MFLGVLLQAEFASTHELRDQVYQSYSTRFTVQRVLSLHQDVETGERGFVLTGVSHFLEPYSAARDRIEAEMSGLEQQLAEQGLHREAISSLRAASKAQRTLAARIVDLRMHGNGADAAALIGRGQDKLLMDEVRREIARLDADVKQRLDERVARAEAARSRTQGMSFLLLGLLGALLFGAAWTNARSMRDRRVALRKAQELAARQAAIFNSAKDGMVTINESGSIESLNPAAARMFGYDAESLVRRDIGTLFEIAPDAGRTETFLTRLQRRRKGEIGNVQELPGRRKDGSVFPTDVAVDPVNLPDGIRYLAVIRDATERKQIDQLKTEFVSTVSHELRTPLTSIAGSLGLLAGGAAGALPDNVKRLIGIAHANSERLVRLINDILDIEKIESGKMRFEVTRVPLQPLLEHAVQANFGFAAEHEVRLELAQVPPDTAITADADRMMQVLTNLLSNAIKYSPAGDVVIVSTSLLDRRVRISVRDHGPGIAEEFRSRIFSKFAQADSTDTRQKGGTGLGLSIVREIVEKLGGSVSFENHPDGGAVFHVDLPSAQLIADPGSSDILRDLNGQPGEIILLHVEDDPDMLRLVASAFEGRAQVRSTPSVEEARAALRRYRFDCVILDIAMADGSGLELVPILREPGSWTPVVVFTAQDVDREQIEAVDAVLVKSRASLDRLVQTVSDLAAQNRSPGEREEQNG